MGGGGGGEGGRGGAPCAGTGAAAATSVAYFAVSDVAFALHSLAEYPSHTPFFAGHVTVEKYLPHLMTCIQI